MKLPDDARDELLSAGGGPFGPAERPMAGYVTLPDQLLDDAMHARAYLTRALEHVAAVPPKKKRKAG